MASNDEVYKQIWEYLRHLEVQRARTIQWYAAIIGVTLATGLASGDSAMGPTIGPLVAPLRAAALVALSLYSLLVLTSLDTQKTYYDFYNKQRSHLDGLKRAGAAWKGPRPFELQLGFTAVVAVPVWHALSLGLGMSSGDAPSVAFAAIPVIVAAGLIWHRRRKVASDSQPGSGPAPDAHGRTSADS